MIFIQRIVEGHLMRLVVVGQARPEVDVATQVIDGDPLDGRIRSHRPEQLRERRYLGIVGVQYSSRLLPGNRHVVRSRASVIIIDDWMAAPGAIRRPSPPSPLSRA